jgi:hypothetical protein|nr:MAG TPA: Gas vesicle protein G [Caudoviricetes sp.]
MSDKELSNEKLFVPQENYLSRLIFEHLNDTSNSHNVTAKQTGAITKEEFLKREQALIKEINKLKKKIKKLKKHK